MQLALLTLLIYKIFLSLLFYRSILVHVHFCLWRGGFCVICIAVKWCVWFV
jgi:hypothetical protein